MLICSSALAQNHGAALVRRKYWEIIADNLSKAGWSWGCVSAVDSNGRTIWIVDAHRRLGRHSTHRTYIRHKTLSDSQGVCDAFELLSYVRRKSR
jgi:hypothetical protein